MTFVRTLLSITALTTAALATSAGAATDGPHDSHHPAAAGAVQIAQAAPGNPAMGMGGMGAGATTGKPADMATRQGMMEQRMDMMQSMMQMMMDRMPSVPVTK